MRRYPAVLLIVLCTLSFPSFAQRSKGDKYLSKFEYSNAIKYYLKAYKANPDDTASLVHLAKCYSILRDYDNAETYYAKAVSFQGISESTYFNYGEVLKYNGKIGDARQQFVKANAMKPSDSAAAREVRYCDKLKQKFYIAYVVKTVNTINSVHAEFSPALYMNDLVFVSDRDEDIVNDRINSNTGGNIFKIFYAHPTNDGFENPKKLSFGINKTGLQYNIGPAAFSSDGQEMYITSIGATRKSNFVNHAKIFCYKKDGNSWGKPESFAYNNDSYSTMDVTISNDGKTLFFSSDMPGGFGGYDIYVCERNSNGDWSQPKNLGSEVNTPGNEISPYMRNDGVLFFSSDRHFNFGGFDIFSCSNKNGKWTNVENLGQDINSSADDLGICFNSNNRTGYFSSNRKGGKGLDDIYSFIYVGDYMPLKGMVLFSANVNDPVPQAELHLLDAEGKSVNDTKTDNNGRFIFSKLQPDQKYLMKLNEDDPRFAGKKKFYLADSTGRIVEITAPDGKNGKYVFTGLPSDLTGMQKYSASDQPINLAGNLLQGDSSKPMAGAKVSLVNANQDVLQSVTTNTFGAFVFTALQPDENYEFKVEAPADSKFRGNTKIVLTDKSGNTIKTFYMGADGKCKFQVLASDTAALVHMLVQDPDLRLELKQILLSEQKEPLPNVKVSVVDKGGSTLQSTITDPGGAFTFSNLPADKSNMIQVDASDPKVSKMKKLYITDSKNTVTHELNLSNGAFKFEMLPADKSTMGKISVYDPWIEALNLKNNKTGDSMHIIENVYYDYEKWDILPAASRVLDKVVKVMKNDPGIKLQVNAYTDPRGSDEFNMQLSQKRADAAVAYLVAHGIGKSRVTGKGYGKTHPINNCGDPNVHCTDAEFAANRRTEFKIIRKKK